jgi:hypothetical protein
MAGTEEERPQRDLSQNECRGDVDDLISRAEESEKRLRQWLNNTRPRLRLFGGTPPSEHPVTIYCVEQVASHIHSILFHLRRPNNKLVNNESRIASLCLLLEQTNNLQQISRENAWELAGEFERQLIALGDDTYLYTLLKDQLESSKENERNELKHVPSMATWNDHFPLDDPDLFCRSYEMNDGKFSAGRTRCEVRQALRHLHLVRSEEHRRDRARIYLRAGYFGRLALLLTGILIFLCGSYLLVSVPSLYEVQFQPTVPTTQQEWPFPLFLLLLVFFSGALGDVVSRAYSLGRQSLRAETAPRASESPLGIRLLLSQGASLFAQVVLGGTAAVIVYIVVQLISPDLDPVVYGVVGFLAGYSEAFFSRMLQETAGMGQRVSGL